MAITDEIDVSTSDDTKQSRPAITIFGDEDRGEASILFEEIDMGEGVRGAKASGVMDESNALVFSVGDEGSLVKRRDIVMDESDTTDSSHGDSHGSFRDSIHGGRDTGSTQLDMFGEESREVNRISREIDEARMEDDIVVSVRNALMEQF